MGAPRTSERSRCVTRRRALGALAGLGGLTVGAPRSSARSTEIATVVGRGRALETATVPAAWYDRERHARAVLAAVRDRYADVAGVRDVTLGADGDPVADRPTSSVDVHVDPAAGVGTAVPSAFDGIRSRVVEGVEPTSLAAPGTRNEAVGGAATLRTAAGATASATCEVIWRGDSYLMSCAHLFEGSDGRCGSVVGQDVYAASGARVGRVVEADLAQDWTLIDNASADVGFDEGIAGVPGRLCGRVTAMGLQHLKSEGVAVRKKGQATPERRGPVRAVGVRHGGCDLGDGRVGHHYVDVDVPARPGDSGGPVYHAFAYNGRRFLALVGAVSASVEYTRATAAYGVHREHGIEFAPSFPDLE